MLGDREYPLEELLPLGVSLRLIILWSATLRPPADLLARGLELADGVVEDGGFTCPGGQPLADRMNSVRHFRAGAFD